MLADRDKRWRWCPRDSKWYTYAFAEWDLVERDLGETQLGSENPVEIEVDLSNNDWQSRQWHYRLRRNTSAALESTEVQLFEAVSAAYEQHRELHPHAVWSLFTGEWHEARERTASPPPPPGSGTGEQPPISERCQKQLDAVRVLVDNGTRTAAQGNEMSETIARNCVTAIH